MPAAHVQSSTARNSTVASLGVTITAGITGNTLMGYVWWDVTTETLTSITDGTNTYTLVNNPTAGSTERSAMFYASNITGAPTTITATFSNTVGDARMVVHEASGLLNSGALDNNAINYQAFPTAGNDVLTSGSVTTTTDGQYIFGATSSEFATIATGAGTGFTLVEVGTSSRVTSEYQIQTTGAALAATFNGGGDGFLTGIMTFKAAAGTPFYLDDYGDSFQFVSAP